MKFEILFSFLILITALLLPQDFKALLQPDDANHLPLMNSPSTDVQTFIKAGALVVCRV